MGNINIRKDVIITDRSSIGKKSQIYKCDPKLKVTSTVDITHNKYRDSQTSKKILLSANNTLIIEK